MNSSGVARGGTGGDICPRAQGFRGRQNRQFAQIIIALREPAREARAHLEKHLHSICSLGTR